MSFRCRDCSTLNNASGIGYAISQYSNVDMIGELLLNTKWLCEVDSHKLNIVHAITACVE